MARNGAAGQPLFNAIEAVPIGGGAIGCRVVSVDSCLSCCPLLYHVHHHIFKFRANRDKFLLKKSIISSFETIEHRERLIGGENHHNKVFVPV